VAQQQISAELRKFFAEEVRLDANATLETARWHLRDFYERGPEDPVLGEIAALMAEVDELLVTHDEHTPLSNLL
jgi:hypothetical protein